MNLTKINSWEIINKNVIIKTTDLSVFKYNSSGIPQPTKYFWEIENLSPGEKKHIILQYKGVDYPAYFSIDKSKPHRAKLIWSSEFSSILKEYYPLNKESGFIYPLLRYNRIKNDIFQITLIDQYDTYDEDGLIEDEFSSIQNLEGKKYKSTIIRYSRNVQNRTACIKIHGTKCYACGFDFELFYGTHGENFIEIHHLKMLSELDDETIINPETDLIPLCSNCHRMIHRNKENMLSIDELKKIIFEQK